jgi:predicted unusual protein kinase regulating ubiquinone biosynthesis (AarF/ABC1/UbiB family)
LVHIVGRDLTAASDWQVTFDTIGHVFLSARRLCQIVSAASRFFILPKLRPGKAPVNPEVRLRLFFEHLGGAWIKVGQALSVRFDLLPSEYCAELLKLLNQTATVPYEAIRETIRSDLGSYPEQIFASFDPVPHAAASIAQVHIATTHDGEKLAIKVQRPQVREQFEADFSIIRMISYLVGFVDAVGRTALRSFSEEFERWSREELDFITEAKNCHRLQLRAEDDPIQVCAEVHFEFCSTRVLATKLLEGISLLEIIDAAREGNPASMRALNLRPDDLSQIGRNFFWSISNQIFRDGIFHADPHPANVFVLPGNRIGFVDFGATGRLSKELSASLIKTYLHMHRGNIGQAVAENFKLLIPSSDTDLRRAREEFFIAYQMFRRALLLPNANPRALTAELLINTMAIARRHRILMPQELTIYYKTIMTVDAVLAELAPEYDCFSDLPDFFAQAFVSDVREGLHRWPELILATKHRANRSLVDANSLAASSQFFNPALKSIQTRSVLYGIWSIALCIGAYLASQGDLSLLEEVLGVSSHWLVIGFLTPAIGFLLLMQRRIRDIRKVEDA